MGISLNPERVKASLTAEQKIGQFYATRSIEVQKKYAPEITQGLIFLQNNNMAMVQALMEDALAKLDPNNADEVALLQTVQEALGLVDTPDKS